MRKGMNKRGNLLIENVIFILLNFVFLAIMVLFLFRQGSGTVVLEQSYSKNIALLIDSAKPGTEMRINMEDAMKLAEGNGVKREEIIKISGNIIVVRLTQKGGYQYSFFNDVNVSVYPDENPAEKYYIIKINRYNKDE
jgi:hypothetical protein